MQPPTEASDGDEPLYEQFYGLREQPFALSTDPKFIFWSASHRRAFDDLLVGLRRREGLLLLTGETGTGKTTLCRAVIDALGHRTFTALVLNPYMAGTEVLRVVLRDFGLVSRDEIRRGSLARADVPHLLDTLEGFLRSLVPLDARAVVIVDEAQSLSPEALDQVRMLGAYEEDGQRLLQIVLCGQPGLLNTLKTDPLRALNERITRRAGLNPLLAPEVEGYVRHRLSVAGAGLAVVFAPDALRLITEYSRGLPRRINVLCDRALDEGRHGASRLITADTMKRAARSLASPSTAAPSGDAFDVPAVTAAPITVHPPSGAVPTGTGPPRLVAPPQVTVGGKPAPEPNFATKSPLEPPLEQEAAPRSSRSATVLLGTGAILVACALAVGYYGWTVVSVPPTLPKVPPAHLALGAPASAPPVPSDAQLKDLLDGRWSVDGARDLS